MSQPAALDVDVVIINFNTGHWLQRCVEVAQRQQPATITVVDNASDDDSLGFLDSLTELGSVQLQTNPTNVGFAAAANQAAHPGSASYVMVLNPDCLLADGALAALVKALQDRPKAGIAGPLVRNSDGSEQRACRRRTPTPWRSLVTMTGLERLGLEGVNVAGEIPQQPLELDAVSGAALMIRRECWTALGGYDEGYFLHCEDLDLFQRARTAGWKTLLVPAASATHAKGISQSGRALSSERHKHRGMVRYYRKFFADAITAPLRGVWPALVWLRFGLLAPWLWWRQWRAK